MQSVGDSTILSTVEIVFEARQDHQWNVYPFLSSESGNIDADGKTFQADPGESVSLDVQVTNVGNLVDDLTLQTSVITSLQSGDSSTDWISSGSAISNLGVNETEVISVDTFIPLDAWSGSSAEVTVTAIAQGQEITSFSFSVVSGHVPSWNALVDQANLEVATHGSEITLSVLQTGNSPSRPYISMFISGEQGWEISNVSEMPIINPGESAPLSLNITPPGDAIHGRAVELTIRIKEGDSSGLSEIVFPLRVAVTYDFSLSGQGNWVVSQNGGYPLAFIENRGNAPTTISLDVLSLPPGWQVSGPTQVVIGVGEITGVPLEVVPSSDWDGSTKTIRIDAQDEAGNLDSILLDTQYEDYSWASSPVIVSMQGDSALLDIHGTSPDSLVVDDVQSSLQWDVQGGWVWQASLGSTGTGLTVNSETVLPYTAYVIEPALRYATCSITGNVVSVSAECTVANGTEPFSYTVILIDDQGKLLDSFEGRLGANVTSGQVNLSATSWNPQPGMRSLIIRLLDERGIVIASDMNTFEIRRNDWNIGLVLSLIHI